MRKELPDDSGHHGPKQPQSRFDHESVLDRAAAWFGRSQRSFVTPTTLQPAAGVPHEANALVDARQRESMAIERHDPEQRQPTLEDHASVHLGGQRVVPCGLVIRMKGCSS
jgi:uncharacterized protein (DUF1778 family)